MGVWGWGDNNLKFANYKCVNMADGGIPKPTFHIFVKICKLFFLTCSLTQIQFLNVKIILYSAEESLEP